VLIASAPAELFLDPSPHVPAESRNLPNVEPAPFGFIVRRMVPDTDVTPSTALYALHRMVPVRPRIFRRRGEARLLTYFVAEDEESGAVIGTVTASITHGLRGSGERLFPLGARGRPADAHAA
jgi:hypothetical protein